MWWTIKNILDNILYNILRFFYGITVIGIGLSSGFLFFSRIFKLTLDDVKVENVISTESVVNHDVTVETNITVSDGVTKRMMASKITTDSVTHDMIKAVNDKMLMATYQIVDDRQNEIDTDSTYWNKNVIKHNREY